MSGHGSQCFATYPLDSPALGRFCQGLDADDSIAVEATGNSAWFRDAVASCVGRVVVVNPKQFLMIRKSVKKTDRNDARALALFLSKDMLPETRLKLNKIHALFNRHGIKLKKEGLGSRRRLMALDVGSFSALEQVELRVVRDQALALSSAIAELDGPIEQAAQKLDGYDGLISIKGIGARAAAVFLSGIGKVEDFETADKLAAYVGIVPKVSQSNDTDTRGRITKQGNKLVRTTLVQCTLIATRYSPYLKAYYDRIKARRGAGKAIIATARKFLAIIFNTLKNKWVFEDFTTYTFAERSLPAGQTS